MGQRVTKPNNATEPVFELRICLVLAIQKIWDESQNQSKNNVRIMSESKRAILTLYQKCQNRILDIWL